MADVKERGYTALTLPTDLKNELQAMADYKARITGTKCSPANIIEMMKQHYLEDRNLRKGVGR